MRTGRLRRGFIFLLWPLLLGAAAPVIVLEGRVPQYRQAADAAKRHLADAIEAEPLDGDLAAKLKQAPVVLAIGHRALLAVRERSPTTPVVFCMVLGISRSMLGTQVTGVPLETDPTATLDELRGLLPLARRIGFIFQPAFSEVWVESVRKAAAAKGWTLVERAVAEATEVKGAAESLAGSVDVVLLAPDPKLFTKELSSFLLGFAAERKLPLIGFLESFTQAGALASLSADHEKIGERAGKLAAQVRARPSAPLPLAYVGGNLTINLKTADALGLALPQLAVGRAKRVFR